MKQALAFVLACLVVSAAMAQTITVAAAISLKDALSQAAEQYKAQTGEDVEFAFGSSGQLAGQISNGAPVDLFISAACKQMDDLSKAGVIDDATRKVIAGNSLVLIVPAQSKSPPESIKALASASVGRIAVGEARSVPAGRYARQALAHAGIEESLKEKLVQGMNVRQVLDYVERGEVDAGIVYATDAQLARARVRVARKIQDSDHDPIIYPAAIIKSSSKRAAAGRFVDFVLSERGQACLKAFGFSAPPPPAKKSGQ